MENEIIIPTNKYQTPVTKELLNTFPQEVSEQLVECLTAIEFVKNLISPDRLHCKDLPRDETGRAIIDITNPPIIENTDYFRQPALHYLKHGCYTFLRPNSNPNSEYRKFWDEEIRRCWEGLVRPEDGAWISGYHYWFLNYQPMMINKRVGNSNKAIRVEEFPNFNEGNAWRYYYLDRARSEGHHAIELAKRGAHPYNQKVFTPNGWKSWKDIKIGDTLYGTYGNITTVIDIPYDKECDIYEVILEDNRKVLASDEHLWKVNVEGTEEEQIFTTTELLEIYKNRTINHNDYICSISSNKSIEMPYVFTEEDPYNFGLSLNKDCQKYNCIPDDFKYNSIQVRTSLLQGLIDSGCTQSSEGDYIITLNSLTLTKDITFICRSLGYNCNVKEADTLGACSLSIYTAKELNTKIVDIRYVGRQQAKCVTVDSLDSCYLIGDFVKTHNCGKSYTLSGIMGRNLILGESKEAHRRIITVLTAYQKEYLSDSKDGTLSKFKPALNFCLANTPYPNLLLKNSPNEMTWQMGYKDEYGVEKGSLNQVMAVSAKDDSSKLRGKRGTILFEEMGSFANLLTLYDTTRKSVEDGDLVFAFMYLVGTASEDDSDFSSAKALLYNPAAYNILEVKNVYDKPKQGKPTFGYFFPSYVNRAGCYNPDGVSDVVKSLAQVLMARYKAKNGANPQSILRVIAEDPITPAEAIIKVKAAYFPVAALTERLQQLDLDPHAFDDVFTGKLVFNNKGEVEFMHTEDSPIRKYGVPNDTAGCIEIFEMPEKTKDGIPDNRYIIGSDPVDQDQAESTSLYSVIVFDLWKDTIVAEYTGRQAFADDNFEITRLLCLFYNAKVLFESNKKGWYAYFAKMSSTHLLALTPNYLREKQLVKYSSFGSNRFGVNMNVPLKDYAYSLIRDWLNKSTQVIIDNNDKKESVSVPNLYTIRNRALLEELIAFHPELNVDRISALAQVMLYREEKLVQFKGKIKEENIKGSKKKEDEFFTKNYNNRVKAVNFAGNP